MRGTPVPRPPDGNPLYTPLGMGRGMHRGHLLANRLGGTGEDRRNLTPLYATVNLSTMRKVENSIAGRLDAGDTMYYEVSPHYSGNSLVPDNVGYFWKDVTSGESDYGNLPNTPTGR